MPIARTVIRIVTSVCVVLAWSAVARAQTVEPWAHWLVDTVRQVAVQPDGKIVAVGDFRNCLNGGHYICRFNTNGTIDTTFGVSVSSFVFAAAVQPDGKVLVGGQFSTLHGLPSGHLVRVNGNGSRDTSFNPPGTIGFVYALTLQPDGKILAVMRVPGQLSTLVRLNPDGSLDASFTNPTLNTYYSTWTIAVQADGKIVIGGDFTGVTHGGTTTPRSNVARLNADGSVDTTFDPGANATVYALALQADAKILLGGYFTMLGGGGSGTTPRGYIGRLNADGSLDTSFDPEADRAVESLAVQPDGRILVGGQFNRLAGISATRSSQYLFGRLHPDGSFDTTFTAESNRGILSIALEANGHIVVGGEFTELTGANDTAYRAYIGVFGIERAPAISSQPSSQTVTAGMPASFSAAAAGNPPPNVRWQVSTTAGGTWTDITGAISATYSFTTTLSDNGKWLRAVFTNWVGQAASDAAALTVIPPLPPTVTAQPESKRVWAGRAASFSAHATGTPPPAVQWQISHDSGGTWTNIVGATATGVSFAARQADDGAWVRAVFTNGAQSISHAALLTVRPVIVTCDFTGDRVADRAVYRRTTGVWYVQDVLAVQYGGPGYVPVAADYDGDGVTDIAVYKPATGWWYVRNQFWAQFGHPGDIPVPADYDGDGAADLAVYRPSTGGWYVRGQLGLIGFGGPDYIPVVHDYDGDGAADIAVFRPSTGYWYVRNRPPVHFGGPGDLPIPADYNGDTKAELAVYRPSTGRWFGSGVPETGFQTRQGIPMPCDLDADGDTERTVYDPSNGLWSGWSWEPFGDGMDVPVPRTPMPLMTVDGDYDGDRITDLAVFDASIARWRVRNGSEVDFGSPSDTPVAADYDGDGLIDVAVWHAPSGTWDVRNQFTAVLGQAGDRPVPGDYDGDRLAEIAVYRPSNGDWYIDTDPGIHFGDAGDIPVPGDYNGDGIIEIAVYRPSSGYWYSRNHFARQFGGPGMTPVPGDYNGDRLTELALFDTTTGTWYIRGCDPVVFGEGSDIPVPGDYDGDGTTDIAVYRPSTGEWIVRNQFTIVFGGPGDVPVVRAGGSM